MDFIRETPCGAVRGVADVRPGVEVYRGIRYATARRWEYPQPVETWKGVYDASAFGACCWQPRAFADEAADPAKAFYHREFRQGMAFTYSDDCLRLNVWCPEGAAADDALPVIVYVHGGAFMSGCGNERPFDAPVWPGLGCVAVTLNYRLGPWGFVCLEELEERDGHTGNYGLFDQLAALEWVRRNIAAFGGDPCNVTLMGQSAGAVSVQQLLLSPLARGRFAKAVLASGGGVVAQLEPPTARSQFERGRLFMKAAGCANVDELRGLHPREAMRAWTASAGRSSADDGGQGDGHGARGGGHSGQRARGRAAQGGVPGAEQFAGPDAGLLPVTPVVDGVLLAEGPAATVAAGRQARVPCLMGLTSDDMMPSVLCAALADWCLTQDEQGGPACYGWLFDRRLPGDDCGAWHSSDLWYWFGGLHASWRPFGEKDRALSAQMANYLVNFARTGNPNGTGLPRWEAFCREQRGLLRLGELPPHMVEAGTHRSAA